MPKSSSRQVFWTHATRNYHHHKAVKLCSFLKIHQPYGEHYARAWRDAGHAMAADARIAGSTAVNSAPSPSSDRRTTAPASLTSMTGAATVFRAGAVAPETIDTKSHVCVAEGLDDSAGVAWRAARPYPKTCCGQTCQRRATSGHVRVRLQCLVDEAPSPRPTSCTGAAEAVSTNAPKSGLRVVINVSVASSG